MLLSNDVFVIFDRVTSGTIEEDIPDLGLVSDGTKCAENKVRILFVSSLVSYLDI